MSERLCSIPTPSRVAAEQRLLFPMSSSPLAWLNVLAQTLKLAATVALVLLFAETVKANLPGGGTDVGPDVTLTSTATTATLSNGVVSILCTKAGATINQINYTFDNGGGPQTLQLLQGGKNGGQFYWENGGFGSGTFVYSVVADPTSNGGNYAEIDLLLNSATNGQMDVHFSMLRGSPGFYATVIWSHRASDVAMGTGEQRDNIYFAPYFNWMSVDAPHDREFGVGAGAAPAFFAPQEVSLTTSGILQGTYDDKYKFSADFGVERVWGWSSVSDSRIGFVGKNVGIWHVLGSVEFYNGGPLKSELMDAPMVNMLNGGHYQMGSDSNFAAGEVWTRVSGPYFIYCNHVSASLTDPVQTSRALFADAQAQAAAEQSAWPYSWFKNSNYALDADRGMVTGQFIINDPFNPNATPADLWVGVVQQPSTTDGVYDFQQWMKPYQFWVKSDANGHFTLPHVIAGDNYTLYAFGPGAAGTFMSQSQQGGNPPLLYNLPATPFAVTVTGGATTDLGTVTWTPARVGPTVFELGYPTRKADKFRHGDDYWVGDVGPTPTSPSPVWTKFLEYPYDFPNGIVYTVGQSRWTTDWNFIQPILVDGQGNSNPSSSDILFDLAAAPAPGAQASLYLGIASDDAGPLIVTLNGKNLGNTPGVISTPAPNSVNGFFPSYSGSDANIREENHAAFSDERLNFPASLLQAGRNTLTIRMRKGGSFFPHAMYDYIRLEMTGYVPPAPARVDGYAGNARNLITWPAVPGATSYTLLRSVTDGSGYASVAQGIVGPVAGSGPENVTYVDTTTTNETTYYYVVQSVNPVGGSDNSGQSSGVTPSASLPLAAPTTPANLASSVGDHRVTLTWDPVDGADYYTVQRGTVVNALGYIPIYITLSNRVTNTTYNDASPTNGSDYSYTVTASNAAGTSLNSAAIVARPVSLPVSVVPADLTVTPGAAQTKLSWTAVPGAVGYIIQRSTSPGGPYTYVMSVVTTTFTDTGLAGNTLYYYTVMAMNSGGTSDSSVQASATTAPAAPLGVIATAGNTQVTLNWTPTPAATSYVVRRAATATGAYTTVGNALPGPSFTESGLTNGATYYYVVAATNNNGTGVNSVQLPVIPTGAVPVAPTGVVAAGRNNKIVLTWSSSTGATSYLVQRAVADGGPYTVVAANLTDSTYADVGLVNGTTFYYVVSAVNAAGTSARSAQVSAQAHPTYADWIGAAFPGESALTVIGPDADPDGDGRSNLLEYFLGTDPTLSDEPRAIFTTDDGVGNETLTFRSAKSLSDVSYSIQQSTDLMTWTDTGVSAALVSDQGTYSLMQATVLRQGREKLFLRLSVSLAP